MTREEDKAKTFDILHFVADNPGLSTFEAIEKAYNMGVSEQNKVLNKIRAEIMQVANQEKFYDEKWALGLIHAVKIIDKYTEESGSEK